MARGYGILPFGYCICAYLGLASINLTSSTMGSYLLFLTCLRYRIGPGEHSHSGKDVPVMVLRGNLKNRSCGVLFVDVHSKVLTACKAFGRNISQLPIGVLLDFKASMTFRQIMPL